jgi:hypothetical protein
MYFPAKPTGAGIKYSVKAGSVNGNDNFAFLGGIFV